MISREILERLIQCAQQAMANAYAPVSLFPVGAAILTAAGNIYPGCNTESVIPGLGTCAERSALNHAIVHGEKDFVAVLITSRRTLPIYPCGACRQYLYEFSQAAGRDMVVYAHGAEGRLESAALADLIPHGFGHGDKNLL